MEGSASLTFKLVAFEYISLVVLRQYLLFPKQRPDESSNSPIIPGFFVVENISIEPLVRSRAYMCLDSYLMHYSRMLFKLDIESTSTLSKPWLQFVNLFIEQRRLCVCMMCLSYSINIIQLSTRYSETHLKAIPTKRIECQTSFVLSHDIQIGVVDNVTICIIAV
jgi:hypothetical protein